MEQNPKTWTRISLHNREERAGKQEMTGEKSISCIVLRQTRCYLNQKCQATTTTTKKIQSSKHSPTSAFSHYSQETRKDSLKITFAGEKRNTLVSPLNGASTVAHLWLSGKLFQTAEQLFYSKCKMCLADGLRGTFVSKDCCALLWGGRAHLSAEPWSQHESLTEDWSQSGTLWTDTAEIEFE